jgi:hypothetical protein
MELQDLQHRNRIVGAILAFAALLYIAAVIVFIVLY